jgi:hypothetical protein
MKHILAYHTLICRFLIKNEKKCPPYPLKEKKKLISYYILKESIFINKYTKEKTSLFL